jgi:hypothetical protein
MLHRVRKTLLCVGVSMLAVHSPEVTCATDGDAAACPENWESRHRYIVEATPRRDFSNPARPTKDDRVPRFGSVVRAQ